MNIKHLYNENFDFCNISATISSNNPVRFDLLQKLAIPAGNYMFKVSNGNNRTRYEI